MADCHERGETRIRWTPRPDGLEESVQFTPGYNCPVPGGKGHGVHGMEITWILKGPGGAVQLSIASDWIPGKLYPGHGLSPAGHRSGSFPMGFGVGCHTRHPQYEGHEPDGECGMTGRQCYYNHSFSGADPVLPEFMARGEQAIWDALEAEYARITEAERQAGAAGHG